jgi:HAD superfamily hydrolase (TIGR01490 family)
VSTPHPEDGAPGAEPAAHRRAAAFFDVDNTIIRGVSAYHIVRELYRRDFFSLGDIVVFAGHAVGYFLLGENRRQIDDVRERALRTIVGHSVAEIVAVAEEVYDEVLDTKVFPGAREILDRHLAHGDQVWLVTAGPVEIGDLIARRLGATGAVGTVAEERDGYYTGRLVGDMMHGATKARAALLIAEREGFDPADCWAYGDSANDIPMLSTVGHPCAINPEPRLRRHCAAAGWPVLDFRRRRSSMRRKLGRTAGTAGAAWATAVTVRFVRRRLRAGLRA